MRVIVRGANKRQERHIRLFARFFAQKFFTPTTSKKIQVTLDIVERTHANQDLGEFDQLDKTLTYPYRYHILLRPKFGEKLKGFIYTLGHEFTHMKQVVKGEMVPLEGNTTIFLKKRINEDKVDYYDLPWEIEANGREHGLYKQYLKYLETRKTGSKNKSRRALQPRAVPADSSRDEVAEADASHDGLGEERLQSRVCWVCQEPESMDSRQLDLFGQ